MEGSDRLRRWVVRLPLDRVFSFDVRAKLGPHRLEKAPRLALLILAIIFGLLKSDNILK